MSGRKWLGSWYFWLLLIFIFTCSNLATYFVSGNFYKKQAAVPEPEEEPEPEAPEKIELTPELVLFSEVLEKLMYNYIEPVELSVLLEGAIKGAIEALDDPQTTLYDSRQLEHFLQITTGSFSGVGVRITELEEHVVIIDIFSGSPAEKAGLLPGDYICSIDGEDMEGKGLERAAELLRGPQGSKVTIVVERPGLEEPFSITIERDQVTMETVYSGITESGVGYIRITNFDRATAEQFAQHLQDLQDMNPFGIILDLRDNFGGLVDEAVKVAEMLIPEGEITRLVDRDNRVLRIHYSNTPGVSFPMVVLVNEGTASSAEILAGALQDHRVAVLVGEQTYGKGTVQNVVPLSGGYGLKITVARYLTPSGKDLHESGLEPDYPVEGSPALRYYRYFMPGRLEEGDYGPGVAVLQEMLTELGFPVETSGVFNRETAAALAAYQGSQGIPANGIFDDVTWLHFRESLEELSRELDNQMELALKLINRPALWANSGR